MEEFERFFRTWQKSEEEIGRDLLNDIQRIRERMTRKEREIEELTYERNLIMNHLCSQLIEKDLRTSYFNIFRYNNEDLLIEACNYNSHKKELKGKALKDYKNSFDYAVNRVMEVFFGSLKDEVKFKNICMYRPLTGYDFIYIYKNIEIEIFIPTFIADEKTYKEALSGYRICYQKSEFCRDLLFNGLDYKEIAKKLQTWIKEEGWKK